MKFELLRPSDFTNYSVINNCTASDDGNKRINEILKIVLKDHTNGAVDKFAKGYREAINDIIRQLEELSK